MSRDTLKTNIIHNMDCLEGMREHIPDESVDLTVTSPPYDDLRYYNGYSFDFEGVAKELYRVTKQGGVVVWVIGDQMKEGSETGTSFKNALFFKNEVGFKLHDTMIFLKINPMPGRQPRYMQAFEYMFVLVKGRIKTFNPILVPYSSSTKERAVYAWTTNYGRTRKGEHAEKKNRSKYLDFKKGRKRHNVWCYKCGSRFYTDDVIAYQHPALFPEKLAEDHIISWSNPGDIVLDPFMGSGTTAKMALKNHRLYMGFEISKEYCEIAKQRLSHVQMVLC